MKYLFCVALPPLFCTVSFTAPVPVHKTLLSEADASAVVAFGDCESKTSHTCNPEEFPCTDNDCEGQSFNAYDECMGDCFDECTLLGGYPACYASCASWCDGVPDESVKDCSGGPLDENRTTLQSAAFDRLVTGLESSLYDEIEHETLKCYRICDCGVYCFDEGPPQNPDYQCSTTTNCAESGNVEKVTDTTAGICTTPGG